MRNIGTLPTETARTFADYLLTLKIETQLTPEDGGAAVWVRDEDQVAKAREELASFNRDPSDARYQGAHSLADALRRKESDLEERYRQRQERFKRQMQSVSPLHRPVTIMLLVISIAVAVVSNLGQSGAPVLQPLYISSFEQEGGMIVWRSLSDIRSGQVWRLVTPIFIHFGPFHLILNMMALIGLGGLVESRRGSIRMSLLVLVLAVASNLAQYYLGNPSFANGWLKFQSSPQFGGMSGVLFGLFGYAWMKSRFEPRLGLILSSETVLMMLAWFFLCLLGVIGDIANTAHAAGLLFGLLIGYAPIFWRRLRGDDQLDV